MKTPIDFTKLAAATDFARGDPQDDALIREMVKRAHAYLLSFDWCDNVIESYVGDVSVGGIALVMLAKLASPDERTDEWLWVIVGDLPPAYLVTDETPDPASALDAYIGEMDLWVEAVRTGKPLDDLIPVQTSGGGDTIDATIEQADDLDRRLRLLDQLLVSDS